MVACLVPCIIFLIRRQSQSCRDRVPRVFSKWVPSRDAALGPPKEHRSDPVYSLRSTPSLRGKLSGPAHSSRMSLTVLWV